jgi:hypothetical protein
LPRAACIGCSAPFLAKPSIVVTCVPSFITANVRQQFIRRPSTRTVQAPHWPWSQPFLVPVKPTWMRSASSKVVQGARFSFCATPFTCSVIVIFAGKVFATLLLRVGDLDTGFRADLLPDPRTVGPQHMGRSGARRCLPRLGPFDGGGALPANQKLGYLP